MAESQRFTRVQVNIPIEYDIKTYHGEGQITDISEGGVGIWSNQVFVEGDLVHIRGILGKNIKLDFWVRVKNFNGRKAGCEYEEMPFEMKTELENFVVRTLQARKQSRYENIG